MMLANSRAAARYRLQGWVLSPMRLPKGLARSSGLGAGLDFRFKSSKPEINTRIPTIPFPCERFPLRQNVDQKNTLPLPELSLTR